MMSVKELREKLVEKQDISRMEKEEGIVDRRVSFCCGELAAFGVSLRLFDEFERGIKEELKAVNKQYEYDNNEYYDGIYEGQKRILEDLLGDDEK